MKQIALVVIPTYNERLNIDEVLKRLFALNRRRSLSFQIEALIVDSLSPDGTGEHVQHLIDTRYKKHLHLLNVPKDGLGNAYKRAFAHAEKNIDFDVIVQMDADLSHDPAELPLLMNAITDGADVAVGSRFTDGGLIPGAWPMMRVVNTKAAHFVARYIGGIDTPSREITGGFKAMTKAAFNKIPLQQTNLSGYGIQLFLSNEFVKQNMKITEVPISFRDRTAGESKIRTKDVTEFILIAWSLNTDSPLKQLMRVLLIATFGLLNTVGAAQILTSEDSAVTALGALGVGLVSMLPLLLLERRAAINSSRVQSVVFYLFYILMLSPFVAGIVALTEVSWQMVAVITLLVAIFTYLARLSGLIRPSRKAAEA